MKAVFLDTDTLGTDFSLKSLSDLPLQWKFYRCTESEKTAQRIRGASILVSNKVKVTEELIKQAPQLRLICIPATGYNNVDTVKAKELGIAVCNVPSYSTPSVAQHVFCLMLALAMNLVRYNEAAKKRWFKSPIFTILDYPIADLEGKKLGILGFGAIGKQVAEIGRGFGMEILISQHTSSSKTIEGAIPFAEVLKQSDFLTIHVPLTPTNQNLIGQKELETMKRSAFLINVSRGGIVNEKDLAEALISGRIGGAGFDVLSTEPPARDNPLLQKGIPNLILTPHIAYGSFESLTRLIAVVKENIVSFLEGKPKNLV